jgi:hypothetical protein
MPMEILIYQINPILCMGIHKTEFLLSIAFFLIGITSLIPIIMQYIAIDAEKTVFFPIVAGIISIVAALAVAIDSFRGQ